MALKLNNGGILFTNVTNPGTQSSSKYNFEFYLDKSTGQPVNRNTTEISDPINKFINAIDIDWNGAQLKNGSTLKATLNTTGEMLSILQTAYNYATTYNVKYSGGKLYDDGGTEIKVITEDELTAKSYITTSVADEKYAYKSHQHSQYADRDHNHASYYAPISHASTATKYGVGTDANYGHLKISGAYTTKTSADTALSLEGAHNLYTAFVTRISELTAEIATLNSRVATLEGHHTTKPVTAITVTPETYTLYGKGKTAQLSWSITPSDASNKTVTWSSGNESYASVNSEGVVSSNWLTSGFDNGYVMIKATANDNPDIYGYCKVYVEEARITQMHVNTNYIEAEYGGIISSRFDPRQSIKPGDGLVFNEGFTYTKTSGESVTIDSQTGEISIAYVGETYFNISSNADSNYNVVVSVNITKGNQTLSASPTTLSWGASDALSAKTVTISGNKTQLSVSSSNPNINATISGTTVTITPTSRGINNAKVTIRASETDKYKASSVYITVNVPEWVQYYWYAGWTEPSASNIAKIIDNEYPAASDSTTNNKAGKTTSSISGVTMDYTKNTLFNSAAKTNYYVVVPNGQSIYDVLGTNVVSSQFANHSTFTNHTVYKSTATSRFINAIIIR